MKTILLILLTFVNLTGFGQILTADTIFGNGGQTLSPVLSGAAGGSCTNVFKLSDNSILLCGYYYDINSNAVFNLMLKTDACGNIDSSFGSNGFVKHTFDQRNSGYDYALQADGKIVVCGSQADGNAGSQQFPFVARYLANGIPDTTFGVMGTNKINYLGPNDFTSVYILPNGKLLCTNGTFMMR
ncbi:MAG: hypothetical protein WED33_13350, partial [Bacteroidia bacterium]